MENFDRLLGMERADHGPLLKAAMARRGYGRKDVATYVGVEVRTVTNWTSGTTMPSDRQLVKLREMLGDYDVAGDPVEVAVRSSELVKWRQDDVLTRYERNLYEQRREAAG